MTRVLVTGGAGFIGSHLVDALLARGASVSVIDVRGGPNLDSAVARGADLSLGDVSTRQGRRVLPEPPELVYHLAARTGVRDSALSPEASARTNVVGTVAALELARRAGARFVLASTAAVYGEASVLPTPENASLQPGSPYGASKVAAEAYVDAFRREHGLSAVTLRLADVYGPRQRPHGAEGVVAIFSRLAVERQPVTVHGDGRQTRDYVYVNDVVAAFLAAGNSDVEGAVNVASGRETSILELAEVLSLETQIDPSKAPGVCRSCLDPTRAFAELGWCATTPLDVGLRRTCDALPMMCR